MKCRFAPALLGALLSGCATMAGLGEAPRVSLVSIVPLDVQLLEQRFAVTLQVQNPNARDITIRGLDYAIEINDKLFAQGVSGKAITIPAYGMNTAQVEVVSTLQRVMEQLEALSHRARPSIDYAISGSASIDGIPIPVPFEYRDTLSIRGIEKRKRKDDILQPEKSKSIAI